MNQYASSSNEEVTLQSVLPSLRICYGDLANPNFASASALLRANIHGPMVDALESLGIEIDDTTDLNDDVARMLSAICGSHRTALALSAVGPYAVLREFQPGHALRWHWVTQAQKAVTPLGTQVAQVVGRFGFQLVNRAMALRVIPMNFPNSSDEVTVYRALFTDTDIVP